MPHTGSWLSRSIPHQDWIAASIRHLCLFGKPGCGKTILCSTVIRDVKAYCERQPDTAYAIFYFSFSDKQKQHPIDLLRSLVVQLGYKGRALSLLQQAFEQPNRSMLGIAELENILHTCFESYNQVFLLIDALDESPEGGDVRHNMLRCLVRLLQKAHNVKLFATSREFPDIRETIEDFGAETIDVDIRAVDEDIRSYILVQLSSDHRLSRLDQRSKALIEETISAKADGMFRWVYCQLQELKKLKSTRPKLLEKALYSLPSTLDETYERMLTGIEDVLHIDVLTLLRWLAYAKSPPSLGELAEATAINLTAGGWVEVDNRPELDDTLKILSGLVTVIGVKGADDSHPMADTEPRWPQLDHAGPQQTVKATRVRLAHLSIKEYLESDRILQSGARHFHLESAREHWILSRSCLIYLTHYSSSDDKLLNKQDLETFPLLKYAAASWFYHAAKHEDVEVTRETSFLCDEDTLHDWLRIYNHDNPWMTPFEPAEYAWIGEALYYASHLGLDAIIHRLLRNRADIHAEEVVLGKALRVASMNGHEKVVQILLEAEAKVHTHLDGFCHNALVEASIEGHDKVVQMLVQAGADVNVSSQRCRNALCAAVMHGQEQIVQILVKAGADVNAWDENSYRSLLILASERANAEIVQTLIDAGAEVSGPEGSVSNMIKWALENRDEQEMGLSRLELYQCYSSALLAASDRGHESVVKTLIDAGADVNIRGSSYHQRGRRPDAKISWDEYICTPLQAAMDRGHEKIAQMLLEAGARYGTEHEMDTGYQRLLPAFKGPHVQFWN